MNIFERAARAKLRFQSSIGNLTTEQLFELPLTARGDRAADLDKVARLVFTELKSVEEVSFVVVKPNLRKIELELQLEIVKHVIATKVAAQEAAEKAVATAERRRRLLGVLASKEEAELSGMTREEIEAEIAKLAA